MASIGASPGPFSTQPLYGGAMEIRLPGGMIDASDLRQIPDHQEVFISPLGDDSCAIVEIIDYQEDISDAEAAQFYFGDLASQNEASEEGGNSVVESVEPLSAEEAPAIYSQASTSPPASGVKAFLVKGRQRVSKFKESDAARNEVFIAMLVVRLPSVGSDVLVSISCPTIISPVSSSSSANSGAAGAGTSASSSSLPGAPLLVPQEHQPRPPTLNGVPAEDAVKEMVASLKINDWALFEG